MLVLGTMKIWLRNRGLSLSAWIIREWDCDDDETDWET